MVDRADIPRVSMLMNEYQRVGSAINNLNEGGRIVEMQIAMGKPPPDWPSERPMPAVSVLTHDMDYPPQMVTSIKALLETRRKALAMELGNAGVTGLEDK